MFEERDDVDFDFDRFDGMCRRNHCSADGSSIPSLISGGRLTRRVEIPSLCPCWNSRLRIALQRQEDTAMNTPTSTTPPILAPELGLPNPIQPLPNQPLDLKASGDSEKEAYERGAEAGKREEESEKNPYPE